MITDGNSEDCHSFLQNIKLFTIKFPLYHVHRFIYSPDDGFIFEVETCSKMVGRLKKRTASRNCYIHLMAQRGHSILKLTPESFRYDERNERINM